MNKLDIQYQHLLDEIIYEGIEKSDRTGTGTKSRFGCQIVHDMQTGFPLLTTKKMAWRQIVTELLWFLRGNTNIKFLRDNNCYIWDDDCYKYYTRRASKVEEPDYEIHVDDPIQNCTRLMTQEEFFIKIDSDIKFARQWGDLGPIYGKQWRRWRGTRDMENSTMYHTNYNIIDQIQQAINDLKNNPDSRRILVTAWNPTELPLMALPPCHLLFQFYTRKLTWEEQVQWVLKNTDVELENLYIVEEIAKDTTPKRAIALQWYQRSVDVPLGLPFNIASYGLLLSIIGKIVNMVPERLVGSLGDTHIYKNQIDPVKTQLYRTPYPLPKLIINSEFWLTKTQECGTGDLTDNFDELIKSISVDDFIIKDYLYYPAIKIPLST